MDQIIVWASLILGLLMLLALYRAIIGPTLLDRLIGVNAIGTKTTVLLILIGLTYKRVDMFVDIALAYAFLNFISILAAARYLQKRKRRGFEVAGREERKG
ncbi:pH regulation protein F [bacterium]|nr:pH regulation protein F [bacterium]